ncbi:MAG: TerB family tellurite resistance protein [Victivallaceae bacterium]|nr:TerB family tellurite resistance protein [Victivallaceae bacterium]
METQYLVISLARALENAGLTARPEVAVRLTGSFSTGEGEGYLFAFPQVLCMAERPLGEAAYLCRVVPVEQVAILNAREGELLLSVDGAELLCRCNWPENADLEAIAARFPLAAPIQEPDAPEAQSSGEKIPTAVLFAAALFFAAGADGSLEPMEEQFLHSILPEEIFQLGLHYYQRCDYKDFQRQLAARLNREQKLCLLTNLFDLLLADGVLASEERNFVRELAAGMDFSLIELDSIETLMIAHRDLASLLNS